MGVALLYASYLYSSIGCNGANWKHSGYQNDIGNDEEQTGFQQAGISDDVSNPKKQDGAQHGQAHGCENSVERSQGPLLAAPRSTPIVKVWLVWS